MKRSNKIAKSKRVSMSKAKLAETGEALEIAGTMAEIEGASVLRAADEEGPGEYQARDAHPDGGIAGLYAGEGRNRWLTP